MDQTPIQKPEVPPKSCIITVMFAVATDEMALNVKKHIDDALKDIPEKRYTFQINER